MAGRLVVFARHHHRRLNALIAQLLTMGMTLRGIARVLHIDKDTIVRRLVLLARVARHKASAEEARRGRSRRVQFDELITIEHTKLKPVSVGSVCDY